MKSTTTKLTLIFLTIIVISMGTQAAEPKPLPHECRKGQRIAEGLGFLAAIAALSETTRRADFLQR